MTRSDKPLIRALQGEVTSQVPCWFMRQAGRYLEEYRAVRASVPDFLSLCYHPEKAAEVTLQPIRRYGMDGAILFSDILVIPDALGVDVRFVAGEGPRLGKVTSLAQVDALNVNRTLTHLVPVTQTITRVKPELPEHVAFLGFAGAPWTVACYMLQGKGGGFDEAIALAKTQPELVDAVIEKVTEATILYLGMQVRAGVDALQIFDSWAGLVPDDMFERLVIAPNQKIAAAMKKDHPHIPLIGFAKSIGRRLKRYAEITDFNGLGVSMDMALRDALTDKQPHQALQGNLDPELLASDLPKALDATKQILDTMRAHPFIFNLGHGMVPHCPPENLAALMDVIRNYAR